MRKTTLFIAMSLDGYIADTDGGIGWLHGENPAGEDMKSYQKFIQGIDTVIMGWNTYHQITTELSLGEWAYKDMTTYVFTHRTIPSEEGIWFVNQDICEFVKKLRQTPGKGIWLCGGAGVIRPLLCENLIDIYHISVIPTILGSGIRLFGTSDQEKPLKLVRTESYNGITDLIYQNR